MQEFDPGLQDNLLRGIDVNSLALPEVPELYTRPIEEAAAEVTDDGLRHGDAVLEAESNYLYLARLRSKALRVMEETLDIPMPDADDDDYARIVIARKDAAAKMIDASLKADENCFRRKESNALTRLYESVKAQVERRAPPVLEGTVTVEDVVCQG